MAGAQVAIAVAGEFAQQLPTEPDEQRQVLELGLREWRIRKALEVYRRGEGSLAFAAQQAGVPLRQMIPLAYAHGLAPRLDPEHLAGQPLSIENAAKL